MPATHPSKARRRRLLLAAVAVVTVPSGSALAHPEAPSTARGCRSGPTIPAWYLSASSPDGYTMTAGAITCRYVASDAGGYESPAGDFAVTVTRDRQTRRYDQRSGRCANDVIEPGDRVTVRAALIAEAGVDSGCTS